MNATDAHCALCPTRGVCVARDLDAGALERLHACLTTSAPLHRGDHLYRSGDPAEYCFLVRSGAFKTSRLTSGGDEYITGFHYPGELIGLDGQNDGAFPESATALDNSTVCRIRLLDLPVLWELGAGPGLLRLLGETMSRHAETHINLCQSRAPARIAGYLTQLMSRFARLGFDPTQLPMPMSRTDLANHLGLTLECLSRVLGKWKRAGVIEPTRDHVLIRKPTELRTTAYHLAA
jgi:CRP/FNR family transcriptional regulator